MQQRDDAEEDDEACEERKPSEESGQGDDQDGEEEEEQEEGKEEEKGGLTDPRFRCRARCLRGGSGGNGARLPRGTRSAVMSLSVSVEETRERQDEEENGGGQAIQKERSTRKRASGDWGRQ